MVDALTLVLVALGLAVVVAFLALVEAPLVVAALVVVALFLVAVGLSDAFWTMARQTDVRTMNEIVGTNLL